jgi:hypothetical protein
MPNVVGNPGSGLRQAQKCIVVKPVNWQWISNVITEKNPALIIDVCLPKVQ